MIGLDLWTLALLLMLLASITLATPGETIEILGSFDHCQQRQEDTYRCQSGERACLVRDLGNNAYEEIECWTLPDHLPREEVET